MFLVCPADLKRAFYRCFGSIVKDERHPVAGRNGNQPSICLGGAELVGAANDLIEQFEYSPLFVNQQLGVADDVDEQYISDLQLDLFFYLGSHLSVTCSKSSYL